MEDPDQFERGHLGLSSNKWLSMVATGRLDIMALVRDELAARGASPEGKWVGFAEAERLAAEPAPRIGVSDENRLAAAFIAGLETEVGDSDMSEIRRKAMEWKDRSACPTHDHCDSNLVMDDAFKATFGREADLDSDSDLALINRGWKAARVEMERDGAAEAKGDSVANGVAKSILGIPTLETRMSDSLDFHDVAVWGIRDALKKAYAEGRSDGLKEAAADSRGLDADRQNLDGFRKDVVGMLQEAGQPSVRNMAEALEDARATISKMEKRMESMDGAKPRGGARGRSA